MKYIMLVMCTLLCSCSAIVPISTPLEKTPLSLADADPMDLQDVSFLVIHKDNAAKTFADLEKKGIEPVVFALTGADYKALATNMAEIKSFLKLQKKILILYRDYYEPKQKPKVKIFTSSKTR